MRHHKWLVFVIICIKLLLFKSVSSVDYIGAKGGAPNPDAFIKYCSMYTNPTKITPKSLKKLHLSVMGTNGVVTPYNYYNVRDIVSHPNIDFKKKTFVFIGSYMDVSSFPLGETMAKVYNRLGYNALLLNYMDIHWRNYYIPAAARLMRPVGKHAAEMLANLTTLGLDPKTLELVGFGYGAQTMSLVAKNYRELTSKNISLLIGLDPAGPCFRTLKSEERLDPSDADFVLSVATNMDGQGIATPVGHVTFYVNGGEYQPGEIWFIPCEHGCSHVRAYYLWISALINPGQFIGMKCDTIQQARQHQCYYRLPRVTNTMDLKINKKKTGIFYLATYNRYPYALGKAGLNEKDNIVTKQMNLLSKDEVFTI